MKHVYGDHHHFGNPIIGFRNVKGKHDTSLRSNRDSSHRLFHSGLVNFRVVRSVLREANEAL